MGLLIELVLVYLGFIAIICGIALLCMVLYSPFIALAGLIKLFEKRK